MRHFILIALAMLAACSEPSEPATGRIVVTDPLPMTALARQRSLRIYLPPGYDASDDRYPVLYMHDAQNLFDDATAFAGEWQVDETLDRLSSESGLSLIVVGIDNGAELRLNEMAPWSHADYGEPEADAYLDFIVSDVKPHIDREYRTLPDRDHTGILGSSMGGLVSFYAAFEHSDVFSRIGALSPSFWWSESVYSLPEYPGFESRFFLVVGGAENEVMLAGTRRMADAMKDAGFRQVSVLVIPGAEHNEALWRSQIAGAVSWLFGDTGRD